MVKKNEERRSILEKRSECPPLTDIEGRTTWVRFGTYVYLGTPESNVVEAFTECLIWYKSPRQFKQR